MYQVTILFDPERNEGYYENYIESTDNTLGNITVEDLPPYQDINKAQSCYYDIENGIWIFDNEKYEEIINQNARSLKEQLIKQSKLDLQEYLNNNPLFSTVKYPDGRYYTVTQEKQQQLTSKIMMYTMYAQNEQSYQLTWNDVGSECEPWTFEELSQLATEIDAYVTPLVSAQQCYEAQISSATTKADIEAATLDQGAIHA